MVALYADGSPALRCRRQLPSSGIRIVLLDIEGSGGSVYRKTKQIPQDLEIPVPMTEPT